MAISQHDRLALTNYWMLRMGERYFPFNQVNDGQQTSAPAFWIQYERDLVALAMVDAWREFAFWLGYNPSPVYDSEKLRLSRLGGLCQTLKLEKTGKLQALGQRGTELLAEAAAITFTDGDGDGLPDTGTVTINLGTAALTELQAFFTVADGAPAAADEAYQIYPVKWVDNGDGTATGSFHRALAVLPEEWDFPFVDGNIDKRRGLVASNNSQFISTLDVYRVYPDPTNAVQLILPLQAGDTALQYESMNAVVLDSDDSTFQMVLTEAQASSQACGDSSIFDAREVLVHYYAGNPLDRNGRIQGELETALVRFANTQMPMETKNVSLRIREQWMRDYKDLFVDKNVPPEYVNPFGIKYGQWEAWRIVARMADSERGHVSRIGGG